MKNRILSILSVSLLTVTTMSTQAADTSRLFTEETATTVAANAVSVDLDYSFASDATATALRVGAFGGEIMINTTSGYFTDTSMGYKRSLGKNFAAYGTLSYYDDGAVSATNFVLGGAYTVKLGDITFNVNPELVSDDSGPGGPRGGKNTIFVKGLVVYKIKPVPVSLVAELILDNNVALERVVNLGARWQPKNNLTVDLVVYSDQGASGPGGADVEIKSIPGSIIVNLLF